MPKDPMLKETTLFIAPDDPRKKGIVAAATKNTPYLHDRLKWSITNYVRKGNGVLFTLQQMAPQYENSFR